MCQVSFSIKKYYASESYVMWLIWMCAKSSLVVRGNLMWVQCMIVKQTHICSIGKERCCDCCRVKLTWICCQSKQVHVCSVRKYFIKCMKGIFLYHGPYCEGISWVLLQQFHDINPENLPNELPPLRTIQHQLDLTSGATLLNILHYRMSPTEHKIVQLLVDDLLDKNLIKNSMSSCFVSSLLVQKKDESWRMCIDNRAINKIIVKFWFSMSRMEEMLERLYGSEVFSKLDLRSGNIRLESDLWMSGRQPLKYTRGCSNGELCHLVFLMRRRPSCVWWMRPSNYFWTNVVWHTLMIYWFSAVI